MVQAEAVVRAARVREASRRLGTASTELKDAGLLRIADAIEGSAKELLAVNGPELERARDHGLTEAFLDRMTLTPERIAGIARDVRAVAALPDPVGEFEEMTTRPNGLQVGKMRVPLGVIGAIYESRPNVTVDIAAVCLKSGNGVLLRSGSDAHATSGALAAIAQREATAAGLPEHSVEFIESTERAEVGAMLRAAEHIDLMVPRGGAELIRRVRDEAAMPVVAGGSGSATPTWTRRPTRRWRSGSWSTRRRCAPRCATRWTRCWCTATWRRSSCRWWRARWASAA